MHRVILDAPAEIEVDHRDCDGLNNARLNLRLATRQQNASNRLKQKNNTSGYKGVVWDRSRGKWRAAIQHTGKSINLGRFDDVRDAVIAYRDAATRLQGEFARPF